MNIDKLISEVYNKYRIQIDRNDPVFQIFFLLVEQGAQFEHEKYKIIEKQIDDIVSGATQKATIINEATLSASKETMKELLEDLDTFLKQTELNTNTPVKVVDKNIKYILYGVLCFTLINTVVLTLLLLTS